MPTNVVPASTFDVVIPAPDDGEAVDRASLVQFVQPSVNRSEFLKDVLALRKMVTVNEGQSSTGPTSIGTGATNLGTLSVPGSNSGDVFKLQIDVRFNVTVADSSVIVQMDGPGGIFVPKGIITLGPATVADGTLSFHWYHTSAGGALTFDFEAFKVNGGASVSATDRTFSMNATRDIGAIP